MSHSFYPRLALSFSALLFSVAHFATAHEEQPTGLIAPHSQWSFDDDGQADEGWLEIDFDAGAWRFGEAPLGYGEKYLTTNDLQKSHTDYFLRHDFTIQDRTTIELLTLRARYDDAAIIYLNGVELCRTPSLQDGKVTSHEGTDFETFNGLPAKALRDGKNTLAVHLFNVGRKSSDIVWDASLRAGSDEEVATFIEDGIIRGPYLQNASETGISVLWRTKQASRGRIIFKKKGTDEEFTLQEPIPTTEHRIRLEGLETATAYEYEIVTDIDDPTAGPHELRTLPKRYSAVPTRVWILGDCGTGNSNARNVYRAYQEFTKDRPADFWLMLGDNAYSDGTDQQFQDAVFKMYTPLLHNRCLWPAVGNHETFWSRKDKNPLTNNQADPYLAIFEMPTRGEAGGVPSGTELYYSFDYGRTHFICLDSQVSDRSQDGAMYRWLQADLAAANEAKYDWIIAYWHHPPYTHGTHNSDKELQHIEMREVFLPLLEEHGVDLTFGGHSHTYERSILMRGHYGMSDTYDPSMHALNTGDGRKDGTGAYSQGDHRGRGSVHTVAGSSGKVGKFKAPHLPFMVENHSKLASVIVDIEGRRLNVTTITDTGEILDYYSLHKD